MSIYIYIYIVRSLASPYYYPNCRTAILAPPPHDSVYRHRLTYAGRTTWPGQLGPDDPTRTAGTDVSRSTRSPLTSPDSGCCQAVPTLGSGAGGSSCPPSFDLFT